MASPTALDESRRAVVVFDHAETPHVLAEQIAAVTGMSATDALIHARYAPGVLPDRLDAALAEQLVEKFAAIGVSAAVVAPGDLLDFHSAHTVHHARLLDAGLEIVTEHGVADGRIPWEQFAVISAGQVPLETGQRYDWNDEHLFATARRSHHDAHRGALPPTMELWLVDHGNKPIRIDQARMNYETLGDAKTDSSAENFRRFLKRLTLSAPEAHWTPATCAYLDHGSAFLYSFPSSEQLQRVTQLQALIARRTSSSLR